MRAEPDLIQLPRPALELLGGIDGLDVVHETDDRLMARTGDDRSSSVPLRAVVLLNPRERVALIPRGDSARIADLWQISFHIPTLEDRERSFAAVTDLAGSIPVYDLVRPFGPAEFRQSVEMVESICG